MDRDSRIRFAGLQGQFFKGESRKGTAENCNCKRSISVRYWVHALPLRHIGGDGHKMLRQSRRDHPRLSLLTIFFHLRVTLTAFASGTVHHATLCVSFWVWPNTTYKLYTFFKYYGRKKTRE